MVLAAAVVPSQDLVEAQPAVRADLEVKRVLAGMSTARLV